MTDRPRITDYEHADRYPDRFVVIRSLFQSTPMPWSVWRGRDSHGTHATHAEAITAADKLAREQAGTVWTTPDSCTEADYGLIVG